MTQTLIHSAGILAFRDHGNHRRITVFNAFRISVLGKLISLSLLQHKLIHFDTMLDNRYSVIKIQSLWIRKSQMIREV